MKRPIGTDPVRIRRATQGLKEPEPVQVDGKTIERDRNGVLRVIRPLSQVPRIEPLRDLSNKTVVRTNRTVAEVPDAAGADVPLLIVDINTNVLPIMRANQQTLLQRINELTERLNEVT